ncbi:MAG: ABC transporter substrate-binding protein [Candidatus Pacebacteria bacterium]|nr:ABC transporter substrate-binding protein [Candidatus Paceibacterota bacterium]
MLFFKKTEQKPRSFFPSFGQWAQFFKILKPKERFIFLFLLTVFLTSTTYSCLSFYYKNTEIVPASYGTLKYGIIGQPQFINPLYAQSSEIDKTILELVFSGLMKYDENGKPTPDLIKDYKFIENGKIFEFTIKDNVKWHDGEPLTIDDVIFTIELIQNPSYLSPLYSNWTSVEAIKTADNKGIIRLNQPYSNLLDNLAALKIMPKHIWKDMPVQSIFKNEKLNIISPIGSGPFKADNIIQNKDGKIRILTLKANKDYFDKKPHIQYFQIYFLTEKKEDNKTSSGVARKELTDLLRNGLLDGGMIDNSITYDEKKFDKTKKYNIKNTDYFAIFLNTQTKLFSNAKIRQAINLITDKEEIMAKSINGQGYVINSPILSEFYNDTQTTQVRDIEKAKELLTEEGFVQKNGSIAKTIKKSGGFELKKNLESGDSGAEVKKLQECLARDKEVYPDGTINGNFGENTKKAVIAFQEKYADEILKPADLKEGTGKVMGVTLKKLNEICFADSEEETKLSIILKTVKNPSLEIAANEIKKQWETIGISVDVQVLDTNDIKKAIVKKDYDAILFGERLFSSPDLLPYWHSSQIFDPGWNLSAFQNEDLDKALEKARRTSDDQQEERAESLAEIEKILTEESPAIFLYSNDYQYLLNKNLAGLTTKKAIDQTRVFDNISNWYLKEERVWKK